jgi:hypothetical protein
LRGTEETIPEKIAPHIMMQNSDKKPFLLASNISGPKFETTDDDSSALLKYSQDVTGGSQLLS